MSEPGQPVLIWGAGAIGGTVGAFLTRAGLDVTLVDISPDYVEAVRAEGLTISGPVAEFNVRVRIVTPDKLEGRWPIILMAVKAQHTREAAEGLIGYLADDGAVLSLQNGLSGNMLGSIAGPERAYTALVDIAADVLAPGEIRFGFSHPMPIGPVVGGGGPAFDALVATMQVFDPQAFGTQDVQAYIWGKNVFSTLTCTTALAVSPMADLMERPDLEPLWRTLTAEMIAAARSIGITPRGTPPFEPLAFAPGAPAAAGRDYLDTVAKVARAGKPHSGMWRDLAVHRRKTEVEALMAPICELGEANGAPCPTIKAMVTMICEIENGVRQQTDENLEQLLGQVP